MSTPSTISAIVPTYGRADSLERLLVSLATQSRPPDEVIVADVAGEAGADRVCADPQWQARGLRVNRVSAQLPNAVGQRVAAIARAQGSMLLFLDDDVVLTPDCLSEMANLIRSDAAIAAVSADTINHDWPMPTPAWHFYLRWVLGFGEGEWQGRIVGPLLRFGYHPRPAVPTPMEWFGTGNTLVRRSAYDAAGGFSDFFLRRSTMNEDVDLGLKVARQGRILLCPTARMSHLHEPAGRVSVSEAAEDDLYNRYLILRRTLGLTRLRAFGQVATYYVVEGISNLIGAARRQHSNGVWQRLSGRSMALVRILSGTRSRQ